MQRFAITTRPSPYFLVGSFNGWQPGEETYRFREVVSDYGDSGLVVETGSFTLEADLPAGEIAFKLIEGSGWLHQWSVMPSDQDDRPCPITDHEYVTRHGLAPCVIRYRGSGEPPHAVLHARSGRHRFDFHPASGTLTIHRDLGRLPAPVLLPWRSFPCGEEMVVDTWTCLPYGLDSRQPFPSPVCLLFDGRNLLYGEDLLFGHRNRPATQFWRVFDILARHGVIAPAVLVAVGVPRPPTAAVGAGEKRLEAFVGRLREPYSRTIVEQLLPALRDDLGTDGSREGRFLLGHSTGGDLALTLLARHPDRFGGAIALSAGGADAFVRRLEEPRVASYRDRMRVGLSYSEHEISPSFVTRTAQARLALARLGVPHLVHYLRGASHDPGTLSAALPDLIAFVMP